MNIAQKGVLTLIKSAIEEKSYPLPEGFSINEAYDFIIKHGIMMTAYDGAVRCGISASEPAMQKLFKIYIANMFQSEKQMKAVSSVCFAFDENGIDYLPLKGCNIKSLYPKPELRPMGDADILIRKEQYAEVKAVLIELGFEEGNHYRHQYVWKSKDLCLEIHIMPVQEDYERFYAYYGDGWEKAIKTEANRYIWSSEDEFIYSVVHFAKHYLSGGIGLRHAADIFVYLRAFPEMDFGYIENELEKLGILEFYKNIRKVLDFWFEEGKADEAAEMISEFVLQSGNWGTFESAAVSRDIRKNKNSEKFSKTKTILGEAFPPLSAMKERYPVLEKLPVLLPAFWGTRIGETLIFRKKNVSKKLKYIKAVDIEKVDAYRKNLEKAGFDL